MVRLFLRKGESSTVDSGDLDGEIHGSAIAVLERRHSLNSPCSPGLI